MKRLILFVEIAAFVAISYFVVLVLPYLAIRSAVQWMLSK